MKKKLKKDNPKKPRDMYTQEERGVLYVKQPLESTYNLPLLTLILGLLLLVFMSSCNKKGTNSHHEHQDEKVYTCPMHPEIIRNEPADCPICGMDLVLGAEQREPGNDLDLEAVVQATNTTVISTMEVVAPVVKEVPIVFEASGYITYDLQQIRTISARYSGRIDKLYVKYNFQSIEKGQKLMRIYSPEVVTAQEQLLYLINNDPGATVLIEGAKQQLRLLGVSDAQIAETIKSKELDNRITVFSPYSGYLSESINDNGINESTLANTPFSIKEGMYVNKGEPLFKVYNPTKVWAILKLYASDISKVALGQPVALTLEDQSEKTITGKVDFIEPFYAQGAQLLNIRVHLANPDQQLKIGSLVTAKIKAVPQKAMWLPRTAVLDLGMDKIVWLKENGAFKSHKVLTGQIVNDLIEIVAGLDEHDPVALDAQYFVDSQSFIKLNQNENN